MTTYHLTVNGTPRSVEASDPDEPLLYILRNALGLKAAKFGCGLGQCGACTVMIEGEAVRSCQTPVSKVGGRAVTTQEGLGSPENPHKVHAAFIAEQAAQCGYCSNGMIMTSAALLAREAKPDAAKIKDALAGSVDAEPRTGSLRLFCAPQGGHDHDHRSVPAPVPEGRRCTRDRCGGAFGVRPDHAPPRRGRRPPTREQ
jgi:nicotinate dehydrogenase subunit A